MLLEDATGTAFSGDALPISVPDYSPFAFGSLSLKGPCTDVNGGFVQYDVRGRLLPGADAVAEPSTLGPAGVARLAFVVPRRGAQRVVDRPGARAQLDLNGLQVRGPAICDPGGGEVR